MQICPGFKELYVYLFVTKFKTEPYFRCTKHKNQVIQTYEETLSEAELIVLSKLNTLLSKSAEHNQRFPCRRMRTMLINIFPKK